jgi:hypothetical protein
MEQNNSNKRNLEQLAEYEKQAANLRRTILIDKNKVPNALLNRWREKLGRIKQEDARRYRLSIHPFAGGRTGSYYGGFSIGYGTLEIRDPNNKEIWNYEQYMKSNRAAKPLIFEGPSVDSLKPETDDDMYECMKLGICFEIELIELPIEVKSAYKDAVKALEVIENVINNDINPNTLREEINRNDLRSVQNYEMLELNWGNGEPVKEKDKKEYMERLKHGISPKNNIERELKKMEDSVKSLQEYVEKVKVFLQH